MKWFLSGVLLGTIIWVFIISMVALSNQKRASKSLYTLVTECGTRNHLILLREEANFAELKDRNGQRFKAHGNFVLEEEYEFNNQ